MKILFAIREPFPSGAANTNRILTYCRGFVEHGAAVKVVVIKPTESVANGIRNHEVAGDFRGTEFFYSAGSTVRSGSFIARRFQDLWGTVNGLLEVWREKRRGRLDALVLAGVSSGPTIALFWLTSRLVGVKLLQERSEYPEALYWVRKGSFPRAQYGRLYLAWAYKAFDGMLIMTNPLVEFLRPLMRRSARYLLVPMTVEPDRFIGVDVLPPIAAPYVAYCGDPSGTKDGVPILLEAFGRIASRFPELKLAIIGGAGDQSTLEGLRNQASQHGIADRLILTGFVPRENVPAYLCNARVLALARPTGLQAQGGFPTKLGEYLATGRPVVITAVGEIPLYLEDGKTAFIAAPDSAESFADKLAFALQNEELAQAVGENGRRLALERFNYRVQAGNALAFIRELNDPCQDTRFEDETG